MGDAALIIDDLFQGVTPEEIDADVVVCLTRRAPAYLPERAELEQFLVVWWPIDDGPMPDEETVRELATFIAALRHRGKRILVHCMGGNNRSGLVVARTLIELGYPPSEAIETVREAIPTALSNPHFEEWLLEETA